MRKADVQELLFIAFVISAAIAIFTENGFFDVAALASGISFGSLLAADYMKD